jgi:arylsulfatase A-like enzyme
MFILPVNEKTTKMTRFASIVLFTSFSLILFSCDKGVETKHPNILFAISDDQSFVHTSAAGCEWVKTPAFDRVAAEGLFFANCYTPNAKCAPSRSIIISGRNSWQLGAAGNHVSIFPDEVVSVFEVIDSLTGYVTGFTGKGVEPVDSRGRLLTGSAYREIRLDPPAKHISNVDYAANFKQFLESKPADRPFLFWYGGHEPHRAYEFGAGKRVAGKDPGMIDQVPQFWPDNDTVRQDMLDYAFEIEHFDSHLGMMIALLEERGELEHTIIIVTADNGMPFPRCKGFEYEYSNHMPLAIMWPEGINHPGRKIDDYISFIDFAPTILELAGVDNPEAAGMLPVQGKSLVNIFSGKLGGQVDPTRDYVLLGQERHDVGRPDDVGYPIRSIIRDGMLYMHNFAPDRWPACNPETGYLNTDGSPTKTNILDLRREQDDWYYWDLNFGKHPAEELYNIDEDPYCMTNLAEDPEYDGIKESLREKLFTELKAQGDPRMFGNGEVFDEYPYAHENVRDFYNRYMSGEIQGFVTPWVNISDYEPASVE